MIMQKKINTLKDKCNVISLVDSLELKSINL